jgi:hypothetical protein
VKARGRRDLVAVVGHAASISASEFIHAVGVSLTDRTHGLQFKADLLKTTPPRTAEGIEKHLGSGMTHGIGPKLAKGIVGVFREATFEIIEAALERLREVPGIGEFRACKIAAGWAEQNAVRDIMVFLPTARRDAVLRARSRQGSDCRLGERLRAPAFHPRLTNLTGSRRAAPQPRPAPRIACCYPRALGNQTPRLNSPLDESSGAGQSR